MATATPPVSAKRQECPRKCPPRPTEQGLPAAETRPAQQGREGRLPPGPEPGPCPVPRTRLGLARPGSRAALQGPPLPRKPAGSVPDAGPTRGCLRVRAAPPRPRACLGDARLPVFGHLRDPCGREVPGARRALCTEGPGTSLAPELRPHLPVRCRVPRTAGKGRGTVQWAEVRMGRRVTGTGTHPAPQAALGAGGHLAGDCQGGST